MGRASAGTLPFPTVRGGAGKGSKSATRNVLGVIGHRPYFKIPGKTKTLYIAKESGDRQAKYVRNQGVANSAGGAQDEVPAMRDRYCHFCESLLSWNMQDGDSSQNRRPNNICVKLI